ncbi:MAG: PhzF family phenazine biosynthesis protein [Acidimicrobiia bacterium]|nr:PhzF family phenazine biosynthesis protein [Acidimicrobiia bacterium]
MELPLYQLDAFSSRQFAGNPAAVCPLPEWLPAETMQAIAAENNLAETAFLVANGGAYGLRWFTPACEVDLCGHATLAAAYALFHYHDAPGEEIVFHSPRSGELIVRRQGDRLCLDFPARQPQRCTPDPRIMEGLGAQPLEILVSNYYLAVFESEETIASLQPSFPVLKNVNPGGIIVTAPGKEVDFVSRFFAPAFGIDEDPVTGSAHCSLTPYWSRRLGKKPLTARQISPRGGELWCEDRGDRIWIAGHVAPYLKGTIYVG